MKKISTYKAEANLREKIEQGCSLAYFIPVESSSDSFRKSLLKSKAALNNKSLQKYLNASEHDSDLYFTRSVLVTTNWNNNDDVFGVREVWDARHTPSHKRTNLEHDEQQVVGHIIYSLPTDDDGNIIQDNCAIDELPSKFHLVTGAVIYKNWEDQQLIDRTNTLIKAIESGNKFVSMEVLFTDFDYAIITQDGIHKVKARDENTAWMTKHLKAYGGSGTCED
ncbi:hypothetical protein LCGC14_2590560, partial [marine sediment metagenome]